MDIQNLVNYESAVPVCFDFHSTPPDSYSISQKSAKFQSLVYVFDSFAGHMDYPIDAHQHNILIADSYNIDDPKHDSAFNTPTIKSSDFKESSIEDIKRRASGSACDSYHCNNSSGNFSYSMEDAFHDYPISKDKSTNYSSLSMESISFKDPQFYQLASLSMLYKAVDHEIEHQFRLDSSSCAVSPTLSSSSSSDGIPSNQIPIKRKRGRPPSNRKKICFECKKVNTPEWRKHEGKDLCNACGLKARTKKNKQLKFKNSHQNLTNLNKLQ